MWALLKTGVRKIFHKEAVRDTSQKKENKFEIALVRHIGANADSYDENFKLKKEDEEKHIFEIIKHSGANTDSYDENFKLKKEDNAEFRYLKKVIDFRKVDLWSDTKEKGENILHHTAELSGAVKLNKWLLSRKLWGRYVYRKTEIFLLQKNAQNKTPIEVAIENFQYENFKIFLNAQLSIKNLHEKCPDFAKLLLGAVPRMPKLYLLREENAEAYKKIYMEICAGFAPGGMREEGAWSTENLPCNILAVDKRKGLFDWGNDHPFVRFFMEQTYLAEDSTNILGRLKEKSSLIAHDLQQASRCVDNLKFLLEIYIKNEVQFKITPKYCADFMVNVLLNYVGNKPEKRKRISTTLLQKNRDDFLLINHAENKPAQEKCEEILKLLLFKFKGELRLLNDFIKNPYGESGLDGMEHFVKEFRENVNFREYLQEFFAQNYDAICDKRKVEKSKKNVHEVRLIHHADVPVIIRAKAKPKKAGNDAAFAPTVSAPNSSQFWAEGNRIHALKPKVNSESPKDENEQLTFQQLRQRWNKPT